MKIKVRGKEMKALKVRYGLRAYGMATVCLWMAVMCMPCLSTAQVQANPYNVEIEVKPSSPTEQDPIQIVVSGEWGNPGYALTHACSVDQKILSINATITQKAGVWAQVVSRWEFAEDIGKLPAGFYVVEANINGAVSKAEFQVLTVQEGGVNAVSSDRTARLGETLEFSFSQALNPGYGWTIKSFDPNYLKLIKEEFEAPNQEDFLIGATNKVFVFKAIKKGRTQVVFADCALDTKGSCERELGIEAFWVAIE
jgi:hypothetical protein